MSNAPNPPHSIDAEKAVLGSVLIKPTVFSELAGMLATDDFFIPAHREIWDAMRECDRRGTLDVLTVMDELRVRGMIQRLDGGEGYMLELSGAVPTAESARHYTELVRERAVRRRLIALATETAMRAAGSAELGELLAETRASIDALEVPADDGPVRVGDALDEAKDAIEARAKNTRTGSVPTGLMSLDGMLGGLRPGQQIVVAANPGGGKSSLAWVTAIRAAMAGVPALCFSLEMSRQELIERALTFVGEVPGITNGDVDLAKWDKIHKADRQIRGIPLWVDDRKLSVGRIAAEARRWRSRYARGGLALLVVDYLGLVRSDGRAENRQLEVAAMSRAFKVLAGDLKCPLILVAQLNRQNVTGGVPRMPVLSDLRDSGAIEQDADIVLFPWIQGADTQIIIAKHRNGETGIVKQVRWRGDLMAFFDDHGADFGAVGTERYP